MKSYGESYLDLGPERLGVYLSVSLLALLKTTGYLCGDFPDTHVQVDLVSQCQSPFRPAHLVAILRGGNKSPTSFLQPLGSRREVMVFISLSHALSQERNIAIHNWALEPNDGVMRKVDHDRDRNTPCLSHEKGKMEKQNNTKNAVISEVTVGAERKPPQRLESLRLFRPSTQPQFHPRGFQSCSRSCPDDCPAGPTDGGPEPRMASRRYEVEMPMRLCYGESFQGWSKQRQSSVQMTPMPCCCNTH